jgi:membrane-bound lytic murein transglycosylase MltF
MTDEKYGHKGLDAPLILAWIEKESSGNPEAVSYAGAKGLTQLMDFRANKILTAMGYAGYTKELVFDPVVNLTGGLYHLSSLMRFWEWKSVKDQNLILFRALHSYMWGSENTEELFNSDKKAERPAGDYTNWILNRREFWAEKLKYWIDDAQKLETERESNRSLSFFIGEN